MRIVFLGSGGFAVPVARALRNSTEDSLAAVVTQPDRPSGRGRAVGACPVKALMAPTSVPVLTPERIGDAADELAALRPDVIVVADYGQYIPSKIFEMPRHRSINVHPSLLPKYRGAAPIPWAIANGETMTGVTIQYVAKRMDSGDVLLQQEFEIAPAETAPELERRLAEAGAALLLRALDQIRSGHVHATPQDESHATLARKLTREDGRLDWMLSADVLARRVRAFQPWPGTFCGSPRGSLKVLKARAESVAGATEPGVLMEPTLVACGEGALRLVEVQPEGKRPMPADAAANGRFLLAGDRLT